MNFKIVADSSVTKKHLKSSVAYETVPLKIITSEREFIDDDNLDIGEMAQYLSEYKGKSGTSCPAVADWIKAFGDAKRIFCLTITGTLSGSFNSARLAKEEYEAMYPDRRVFVFDTLSAGPEIALLIEKIAELIEQGKEFKSICEEVITYKMKTGLMFSLESLRNLANNGRVSGIVAKAAGILGIRVIGQASAKGDLEILDKCRGEQKALERIVRHIREFGFEKGKVRIDQCENENAANKLKNLILSEFPKANIIIGKTSGLCSFYAEKGGLMVGFEKM